MTRVASRGEDELAGPVRGELRHRQDLRLLRERVQDQHALCG
jgi:hypothetical protein